MERAKWVQNVGAAATWACVVLLLAVGAIFVSRYGSVHAFTPRSLLPDLSDLSVLGFFGCRGVLFRRPGAGPP